MLQQTRVETVLRYFPRFMERFPDVRALAEAPEAEVLKCWEGLGYSRRARALQQGAKQVMAEHGGTIPGDVPTLLSISGIGDYTAGAIAAIAFGQPVPAVDGNVIRVLSRLTGLREDASTAAARQTIAARNAAMIPPERPGEMAQALMDLGATVCVPGTPDCAHCPLMPFCDAYRAGDAASLPVLPRRKPPRELLWDVCLVTDGRRVLLRCRTEAMLQGLWVFPMLEGHGTAEEVARGAGRLLRQPLPDAEPLGEATHVFTHQVWRMRLWLLRTDRLTAPEGWRAVTARELTELALPSAMRVPLGEALRLLS